MLAGSERKFNSTMPGTPFISFLRPSNLSDYDRRKRPSEQPLTIPKTFIDAMEVREQVFVFEQHVPLENEFDSDDARSCHWASHPCFLETLQKLTIQVVYASINTVTDPEAKDADGNIIQRRKSSTRTTPIGTIRLVPFPHAPHPQPGSKFTFDPSADESTSSPPYIVDRSTTYHDGIEPYVKLGRIAVVKEFRGAGMAKILANAAITWAQQNPTFFNPSVTELGLEKLGATKTNQIPVWKGLVCVHAQKQVEKTWEKWGFKTDEGMGTWDEEGIMHVGMFRRLNIQEQPPF
jgi:predicted GNAT family N-acyltransferase